MLTCSPLHFGLRRPQRRSCSGLISPRNRCFNFLDKGPHARLSRVVPGGSPQTLASALLGGSSVGHTLDSADDCCANSTERRRAERRRGADRKKRFLWSRLLQVKSFHPHPGQSPSCGETRAGASRQMRPSPRVDPVSRTTIGTGHARAELPQLGSSRKSD